MKFLTSLFLLLVTTVAFGATAQVNSISQGGFKTDAEIPTIVAPLEEPRRLTLFNANYSITGGDRFFQLASLASPGGQYQVAGTGSLDCFGVSYATSAPLYYIFGYGDTAVVDDDASAPTNPVYFATSSTSNTQGMYMGSGAITTFQVRPIKMSFAASKYPFMKVAGSAGQQFQIQLDCFQN